METEWEISSAINLNQNDIDKNIFFKYELTPLIYL